MSIEAKITSAATSVIAWATQNYGSKTYAWDNIVECWTREEIEADLRGRKITSSRRAIQHFRGLVRLQAEQRNAVRAEAF